MLYVWNKIDAFFKGIYNWGVRMADSKYATLALVLMTFANSSFFPIPPEPLYMAMCFKRREDVWKLAALTTIMAALGGYVGYIIGSIAYDTIGCYIINLYGSRESFEAFRASLREWGFWIVIAKGVTPIPYKIVAIGAGLAGLNLWKFTIASIIGRAIHFFYVAFAIWYFGDEIKEQLDRNFTKYFLIGLLILVVFIFYMKRH